MAAVAGAQRRPSMAAMAAASATQGVLGGGRPCTPTSLRRRLTKVSVIGAGNVGRAIAQTILTRDLADEIALVDALPDKLRGEMLDLQHAAAFLPRTRLVSDTDLAVTRGSDLAIVTAGARQIPAETGFNLLPQALSKKILTAPTLTRPGSCSSCPIEHLDVNAQDVQGYVVCKHGLVPVRSTGSVERMTKALHSHQMASNPLPQYGPWKAGSVVERAVGQDMAIPDDDGAFVAPGMPAAEVCIRGANVTKDKKSNRETAVVIVGAGRSGLAAAACLREKGVPFVVLERADRIAPFWQDRTNDCLKILKLQFPERFHELPLMSFPDGYPEYPTGRQYVDHLEAYASRFDIEPEFNCTVLSAQYDETSGLWRVRARATDTGVGEMECYLCRWLVVATGENAHTVVPNIPGLDIFAGDGEVTHVGDYKSGEAYLGKRVLVVGPGSSGMEVALDLCAHGARPAVVARDTVHVLPRKVLGNPTLEIASKFLKRWLPVRIVDKALPVLARAVLGDDLADLGLRRPAAGGPLESTGTFVRTPVFDCSDLGRMGDGDIAVVPAVACFGSGQAEFVDGRALDIDAVVLATGYRSNVPQAEWHGGRNGYPATAFPYRWDGHCGLYAVGFTRRSLGGASMDAVRVAEEIAAAWRSRNEAAQDACDRDGKQGAIVVF